MVTYKVNNKDKKDKPKVITLKKDRLKIQNTIKNYEVLQTMDQIKKHIDVNLINEIYGRLLVWQNEFNEKIKDIPNFKIRDIKNALIPIKDSSFTLFNFVQVKLYKYTNEKSIASKHSKTIKVVLSCLYFYREIFETTPTLSSDDFCRVFLITDHNNVKYNEYSISITGNLAERFQKKGIDVALNNFEKMYDKDLYNITLVIIYYTFIMSYIFNKNHTVIPKNVFLLRQYDTATKILKSIGIPITNMLITDECPYKNSDYHCDIPAFDIQEFDKYLNYFSNKKELTEQIQHYSTHDPLFDHIKKEPEEQPETIEIFDDEIVDISSLL